MNEITKYLMVNGNVLLTFIDATKCVNDALDIHKLSQMSATLLGRGLALSAYMANGLKKPAHKLSVIISNPVSKNKIVICASGALNIKGYISSKTYNAILSSNPDISNFIGKDGFIEVIKDQGQSNNYASKCQTLTGNISDDFAYYFTTSENRPIAITCGDVFKGSGFEKFCAVVVEPMPNCPDYIITVFEDIMLRINNLSEILKHDNLKKIFEDNFAHFDYKKLETVNFNYRCDCAKEKIEEIIVGLGKAEIEDIIKTQGKVELNCEFCEKNYVYDKESALELFNV